MSYKGIMEGWDDEGCTGDCGLCDECEILMDQKGDQEYEAYRYESEEWHHGLYQKYHPYFMDVSR